MSSPTPGSDPNLPQGGAPQGQPGWSAPPPPPAQGYGVQSPQGYGSAPAYSGGPAAPGQRPGMVTAAGIIGIVWGGLGLLFGLLALSLAFAFGAVYGLLLLLSIAVSAALLWAGIQVIQDKSPRLLLLISYVAIGVNLLTTIWAVIEGASILSGLLGFVLPGIVVFLLLNPQSKQFYASRGITY
ncbi:hypothetical protein E4P40_08260 [Blastococcus sp. CT_GayMR20]|uniref:hypothetical protein n=1 Tax=Blastococcus sp. CT_GayMR20 TaxID=2559609 RepID=UPI00107423C3|nr:hypothetical protein [Blastococcus sp. CT_GayMR20]TFV89681.1 hypothetical protein E4P40_08165 [Blastococcus sp. CT_GayMR20]TFV89698.1 hypothetical protein E4P40_08260 [Blastococcus sp. CT_GayMR20]